MLIFDSHFHLLSMLEKGMQPSLPEEIAGIECGTVPDDAEKRIALVGENKSVFLSMGAGPWCTAESYPLSVEETQKTLEKEISEYGADAIGECGFDFHWSDYGPEKDQEKLFLFQTRIAEELSIPLIIHSRDADDMLIKHLREINDRTVMHCFSSGTAMMLKLLERGAYISFAGNVTYKNNKTIQDAARLCPSDRILYETDSPYLTPVPLRGQLNRMENTEYTLSFLSSIRGEEKKELKRNVLDNFRRLMKNRESIVRRSGV